MAYLKDPADDFQGEKQIFAGAGQKAPGESQIIENLAAPIYTCDRSGYIKSYNKAAAELWGREPEIGKDLWCGSWKIFEPDGNPLALDSCPMAIALKEGRSIRGKEIIVERPDGQRRNVMPYPDPIFDGSGNVVEAVNMLVDITELKQKENAIIDSENKYRELAIKLQTALKTEEEFISIASHELKTPMTTINGFIQVLLEMNPEEKDKRTNYMLTRSKSQVDRLIRLIRELLDLTKIKAGKLDLDLEVACLNDIVDGVIQDYSAFITTHTIIKKGNSKSMIECDRARIEGVISNLLTNAVKYSSGANNIIVTISEDEKIIQVDVQDFGMGIAKENIPKIFDRFFRAHGKAGGMLSSLGLGLYISADTMKRHNGNIWVDTRPGEGATFHISLPKYQKHL